MHVTQLPLGLQKQNKDFEQVNNICFSEYWLDKKVYVIFYGSMRNFKNMSIVSLRKLV